MSVWWFCGAIIAAHAHAWRIDQRKWFPVLIMSAVFNMVIDMFIAKEPYGCLRVIHLIETLKT